MLCPLCFPIYTLALAALHGSLLVSAYECHITYPTSLLQPVTGSYFSGNVSGEQLTCFGNRDYLTASYLETLLCLSRSYGQCHSIWGSRSIVYETDGSIEVYRVHKLPVESMSREQRLNASQWIQLSATDTDGHTDSHVRIATEAQQAPAEPIFFCARCNDWRVNRTASLKAQFRPAYIRSRDVYMCERHMLFLVASTAALVVIPAFIKALVVITSAYIGFNYGLQRFIMIYILSVLCSVSIPFARDRRNRRALGHYVKAVLWKGQEQDAREVLRHSFLLLDVVFFASLVIAVGSVGTYGLFFYDWVVRENRNFIIKLLISVACTWISSSLCSAFEGVLYLYGWVGVATVVARMIRPHVNPGVDSQVVVATLVVAALTRRVVSALSPYVPIRAGVRAVLSQAAAAMQMLGVRRASVDRYLSRFTLCLSVHTTIAASSPRKLSIDSVKSVSSEGRSPLVGMTLDGSAVGPEEVRKKGKKKRKKRVVVNAPVEESSVYYVAAEKDAKRILSSDDTDVLGSEVRSQLYQGLSCIESLTPLPRGTELSGGPSSFERRIRITCRGPTAAAELTKRLAIEGGAWGKDDPGQRPRRRTGEDSSPLGNSSIDTILNSTLHTPIVYMKSYNMPLEQRTLAMLSDVAWVTQQMLMSVVERNFELSGLHGRLLPLAPPLLSMSDSESPITLFPMTSIRAAVNLNTVASLLSEENSDYTKQCMAVRRRLLVADACWQATRPEKDRLMNAIRCELHDSLLIDVSSSLDIDVLAGVRFYLTADAVAGEHDIYASITMSSALCSVGSMIETEHYFYRLFSPPQTVPTTVASLLLSMYIGRLVVMCGGAESENSGHI